MKTTIIAKKRMDQGRNFKRLRSECQWKRLDKTYIGGKLHHAPWSWNTRLNILKMLAFLELIYRPTKIPTVIFFGGTWQADSQFLWWKNKDVEISKTLRLVIKSYYNTIYYYYYSCILTVLALSWHTWHYSNLWNLNAYFNIQLLL